MRKEDLRRRSHAAEVGHVPVQAAERFWALKLVVEMLHYLNIAVSVDTILLSNYSAHF